jgi:hypothetical protein
MLSEKFPEKVKVRQIVSQRSRVLEASFLREMGSHTLFQRGLRRKSFRGGSDVGQS